MPLFLSFLGGLGGLSEASERKKVSRKDAEAQRIKKLKRTVAQSLMQAAIELKKILSSILEKSK